LILHSRKYALMPIHFLQDFRMYFFFFCSLRGDIALAAKRITVFADELRIDRTVINRPDKNHVVSDSTLAEWLWKLRLVILKLFSKPKMN